VTTADSNGDVSLDTSVCKATRLASVCQGLKAAQTSKPSQGILHNSPGRHHLQGCDGRRRRHNGVLCQVRHGAVSTLSLDRHFNLGRPGKERPGPRANLARWQQRPHMEAKRCLDALQQACTAGQQRR
jgi:hypothetical protein